MVFCSACFRGENNVLSKNKTWFISDLHLDVSRPHLFELFYQFIDRIQNQADALYILGDLFEFWIGDDVIDKPQGRPYLPVIQKLRALADTGVPIYFIQGNRDFLIKKEFCRRAGMHLLPDQQLIDLYGTPTLIMHGDTLCTDDKAYQRLRWLLRRKLMQKIYLSLSPEKRARQVQGIKKASRKHNKTKTYEILDVNQQAVEKAMRQSGAIQLIHGHTHRPAIHEFTLDDQAARRIVLGDWRDKACYLEISRDKAPKLVY